MNTKHRKNVARTGFSYLELQVAFVLFGVALAGLGPLVVMQSRQLTQLEDRFDDETTYYLIPSTSAWARKLGAAASIATVDPAPSPSVVTLIDDGDPGYSETDVSTLDWQSEARANAFNLDLRFNNGGNLGDTAHWQFTELQPGWYEVLVTFPGEGNQASNAPYTINDGPVAKGTVRVNQKQAPSGPVFEGSPWKSLGAFSIASGTLRVDLSDDADGNIIADAVRIVPTGNEVQLTSLEKSLTGEEVTAQVSVTVQVP